tara:strand:+ start:167 stop:787 length:621 start_codon:yes stop_codon:yes gene_type:complete
MNKKSPFYQLDEALFKLVDQLKAQSFYGQFQSVIGKLTDQQQKVVNLSISYFLLVIPILLLLIVWAMNSSLRSTIEDKNGILEEISIFNSKRIESDNKGREVILTAPISVQSELQSRIANMLSRIRIPSSSVTVTGFQEGKAAGQLKSYDAILNFDKLSTEQFSELVKNLEERERMKVSGLRIENRIDQSVLKGNINLLFVSQTAQ